MVYLVKVMGVFFFLLFFLLFSVWITTKSITLTAL